MKNAAAEWAAEWNVDPKLDLVLERVVDVPPERVWEAWTRPELLKKWFTPAPWKTADCEIDLRPGGKFRTVMHGPAGEVVDSTGCYLDVVPGRDRAEDSALQPQVEQALSLLDDEPRDSVDRRGGEPDDQHRQRDHQPREGTRRPDVEERVARGKIDHRALVNERGVRRVTAGDPGGQLVGKPLRGRVLEVDGDIGVEPLELVPQCHHGVGRSDPGGEGNRHRRARIRDTRAQVGEIELLPNRYR